MAAATALAAILLAPTTLLGIAGCEAQRRHALRWTWAAVGCVPWLTPFLWPRPGIGDRVAEAGGALVGRPPDPAGYVTAAWRELALEQAGSHVTATDAERSANAFAALDFLAGREAKREAPSLFTPPRIIHPPPQPKAIATNTASETKMTTPGGAYLPVTTDHDASRSSSCVRLPI